MLKDETFELFITNIANYKNAGYILSQEGGLT